MIHLTELIYFIVPFISFLNSFFRQICCINRNTTFNLLILTFYKLILNNNLIVTVWDSIYDTLNRKKLISKTRLTK